MPEWFDSFTDAIAAGDPEYLRCADCDAPNLPPRQICPECGSTELRRESLSREGEVLSFTEIQVTIPKFRGDAPYTCVLVELDDGIALAGQLRETTSEAIDIGDRVVLGTESREEAVDLLTFRPASA